MLEQVAYTRAQAAEATGMHPKTIERAINAGDLVECKPHICGRQIRKSVILRAELERWLVNGQRDSRAVSR